MHVYDILTKPVLSEKTEYLREKSNIYVFEISKRANKPMVKMAIKEIFNVVPRKVNIVNLPAKEKRNRYGIGLTQGKKKAYVYLDKKDKIVLYEGV